MTTTVHEHIQSLRERWARNCLVASETMLLISLATSKGYHDATFGFAPFLWGNLMLVLPVTVIGYCWGAVVRRRFLAVGDVSKAAMLMNWLSVRCAADGAMIFLVLLLIPSIVNLAYSGGATRWLGFQLILTAIVGPPLGAFFGWCIGASLREALRYRLGRTG